MEPNLGWRGLTGLGDEMFRQKTLHQSRRMGRCVFMIKLSDYICAQLWPFSSYCIPQLAKDFDVVILSYCLAWWSHSQNKCQDGHEVGLTLPRQLQMWKLRQLPLGRPGFCFRIMAIHPRLISSYDLFEEIWVFVSGLKQVLYNFSKKFLLLF
jgi:hypothetical protein